jgi:hypothetical protein
VKRRGFIASSLLGITAMATLKDLHALGETLSPNDGTMPVLFVGHGKIGRAHV